MCYHFPVEMCINNKHKEYNEVDQLITDAVYA